MSEDDLEPKKNRTIQDAIKDINPDFYKWLSEISTLNITRTLDLCTFLLNFHMSFTYFPWMNALFKEIPEISPKKMGIPKFWEYSQGSEFIYGIYIMIMMTYKSKNRNSMEETDNKIDKLWKKAPLVNSFFAFNSINPGYYSLELNSILNIWNEYSFKDKLLPDLGFDPKFQDVINSDAMIQLFDTSFITDFLDSKDPKHSKYLPEKHEFLKILKLSRDTTSKLFNVNSDLKISKFMYKHLNYMGFTFWASDRLIDDIMKSFNKYFSLRIPSKKNEIKSNLAVFGELLKILNGILYKKFRFGKLIKVLNKKIPETVLTQFIERFSMKKEETTFPSTIKNFDARGFIIDYNIFLTYAIYQIPGFCYTGTFLVWRALVKYLESLQSEKEFKNLKGILLENWCKDRAEEAGFQAIKIVLRNTQKKPSLIYSKMKEQIQNFTGEVVEFAVPFPKNYKPTFHEIDFVFKIEDMLFIFECKSTRVPKGTIGDFVNWIDNFNYNINLLANKGDILLHNINKGNIDSPFLHGLKHYVPTIIQTEGLISKTLGMSTDGFLKFLSVLKENIEEGTIHTFLEQNYKYGF